MEILRTEHLSKTYGEGQNVVNAVRDANLSVAKGEFVAIVGSSGSGKSTLMHMMGGVDRPTSGRVFVEDQDIYKLKDDQLAIFRRRQVGLIYQFYNLIPVLDVEENMTLPLELDGRRAERETVHELAETLGLSRHMHHLPNQLSGGQQQRVAIGRALITRPAILLADEPTGNLDTRSSNEIMELLKLSNRKYRQTVIMITHNLELAKQADRVLTIEDGVVESRKRMSVIEIGAAENRKGVTTIEDIVAESRKGVTTTEDSAVENRKGVSAIDDGMAEGKKGMSTIEDCAVENRKGAMER